MVEKVQSNTAPVKEPDDILLSKTVFKYCFLKQLLPKLALLTPLLAAPFLYFLGRLYDLSYFDALRVPSGILSNEITETLLTGFMYALLPIFAKLINYLILIAPTLFVLLAVFSTFAFFPIISQKLKAVITRLIRKVFFQFTTKEKGLEYFDSVEVNFKSLEMLPRLFQIADLVVLCSVAYLFIMYPAIFCINSAKENAKKFLTQVEQSDCQQDVVKSAEKSTAKNATECRTQSEITLKSKQKIIGYLVATGPKEWVIYQPAYLNKSPAGKVTIIKRDDITEVVYALEIPTPPKPESDIETNQSP